MLKLSEYWRKRLLVVGLWLLFIASLFCPHLDPFGTIELYNSPLSLQIALFCAAALWNLTLIEALGWDSGTDTSLLTIIFWVGVIALLIVPVQLIASLALYMGVKNFMIGLAVAMIVITLIYSFFQAQLENKQ